MGPIKEAKTKVRRNKKTATKATEQQIKLTSKRVDANPTKLTAMVLGSLGIGKSTAMNQLSEAVAAPYAARLTL